MVGIFKTKDGITELAVSGDCDHGVFNKIDCAICDVETEITKNKKAEEEANAKDVENPNGDSSKGEKES